MNFIEIDNYITSIIRRDIEECEKAKKRVEEMEAVDKDKLGGRLQRMLEEDRERIEYLKFSANILCLYKQTTKNIIVQLMNIFKSPIGRYNKKEIAEAERKKKKLVKEFVETVKLYVPYHIYEKMNIQNDEATTLEKFICESCGNVSNFIKDGDVTVCKICFSEVIKMVGSNHQTTSFSSSKCVYDRLSHFKECIKQYQCKQNTFIHEDVYSCLENAIQNAGLTVPGVDDRRQKYALLTKHQLLYFMKGLGLSKYYDDYNLIYHNITGKPPPDISAIEDSLVSDFAKVSDAYATLCVDTDRKNFINIQYILLLLLKRNGEKVDENDFVSVKNVDKKQARDIMCRKIFSSLGWKYVK